MDYKKTTQPDKSKAFFFNLFIFLEKFIWVFAILLIAIILLAGYRFILEPQYQKFISKQQETQIQNLKQQKDILSNYLAELKNFIKLTDTLSEEDLDRLNTLLASRPDDLELQIKFKKLFDEYQIPFTGITITEKTITEENTAEAAPPAEEETMDLSHFLPDNESENAQPPAEEQIKQPILEVKALSISFTIQTDDYYAMKDFLGHLENTLPLLDIESITVSVGEDSKTTASITANLYYAQES